MATDVSAPLPDITPEESTILFIDTGDASALITQVVIHVQQAIPDLPLVVPTLPPVVTYGPEAPGLTR